MKPLFLIVMGTVMKTHTVCNRFFKSTFTVIALLFTAIGTSVFCTYAVADVSIDSDAKAGLYLQETNPAAAAPSLVNSTDDISILNASDAIYSTPSFGMRLDTQSTSGGTLTYDKPNGTITVNRSGNGTLNSQIMASPSSSPPGSGDVTGTGFSAGVYGLSLNGGTLTLNVTGIGINMNASHSAGIGAYAGGSNPAHVVVNSLNGSSNISRIVSRGYNADGMNILNETVGGSVTVRQEGDIDIAYAQQHGVPSGMTPIDGIYAQQVGANGTATVYASGNIDIDTGSDINAGARGIAASTNNGGNTLVQYNNVNGHINVTGDNTGGHVGINAYTTGAGNNAIIQVVAANQIFVKGDGGNNHALIAQTGNNGNATIEVHAANLIQASTTSTTSSVNAILASANGAGNASITTQATQVVAEGSNSYGIHATTSSGKATVVAAGTIQASGDGSYGIRSNSGSGSNEITLLDDTVVQGGRGAGGGVQLVSAIGTVSTLTVGSGAHISAESDKAVERTGSGGTVSVNNAGTIVGYSTLPGNATFNNQGTLSLQNFGTGSKNVIVNQIGDSGSTFNNAGNIFFSDQNLDGTNTAAIFNVTTFSNDLYGLIDLTAKNILGSYTLANDMMTINGNYVANGGTLALDTNFSANTSDFLQIQWHPFVNQS
jgi:hypothetical protein